MCPGGAAVVREIVRVRDPAPCRLLVGENLVGNARALAIGHRFFLGVEAQPDLLAHVAGAGPTHQRLDFRGLLRLEIEYPGLGVGLARLHGRFGRLVDACDHGLRAVPGLTVAAASVCRIRFCKTREEIFMDWIASRLSRRRVLKGSAVALATVAA